MTFEIALVFLIIAGALYLFATEKLPLDVTAILILITVMVIPLIGHVPWLVDRGIDLRAAFPTVSEGLSGLSNPATVTVLAMFILSAGIQRAGLIHVLGKRLFPLIGNSELRMILVIALLVGLISGIINNTAAVAVSIPLVLELAKRTKLKASRVLLPVSFFGMLGGTLTLIGTSSNILASSILRDVPEFGREIGLFEFTHLGLIVLSVGLVYFITVGRWLMPKTDRVKLQEEDEYFVFELGVPDGSPLAGHTLDEKGFEERSAVEVLRLVRGDRSHIKRAGTTKINAGDIIQARGTLRQVMDLIKNADVEVLSEINESRRVRSDGQLVRVLLRGRQTFSGKTCAEIDFWSRYNARLIGLETEKLSEQRLRNEQVHVGEIALLQISNTALTRLRRHPGVVVLEEFQDDFDRKRMWTAGLIVAAVVLVAALTPIPIVVSALMGVVAMVASGCIRKDDIYSGVSWDVIFLLAGVIPLGIAMLKSGAADWLGGMLAAQAAGWHPILVLMALYALTTVLTELVSNNAAIVILVPVAISIAQALQIDIFPLVLAVMFAASTSFLSPIGYQTNTMIYGTGLYRFTDFAKVGAPLNVLLMVVTSFAIWRLWM